MRQPTGVNVTGQHGGPGRDPKLPRRNPKLLGRDSKLAWRDSKFPERVQSDLASSH